MTKDNIRIFRVIPFFELQNNTQTTVERWDICLLLVELFCCVVLVPGASGRLACSSANTGREGSTAYTAASPHLYTLSFIQPIPHTCTHCHSYRRFPTPVHTVIHTADSPHLYTLSFIQLIPHTCTHCHTYSRFPTPAHTVIHTAVSPHLYTLSYIQPFRHTCPHFHT